MKVYDRGERGANEYARVRSTLGARKLLPVLLDLGRDPFGDGVERRKLERLPTRLEVLLCARVVSQRRDRDFI